MITDTHFGARNDSLAFNDYFFEFYEKIFFPYLKDNNITTVVHLGDVMDRRKFVSYRIAKDFRERFVNQFTGIDFHMIVGNHDTYYKNTNSVNSLQELVDGKHSNITVYPETTEADFDGCKILFVPWINSENMSSTMKMLKTSTAQICMGHLELNGFEMQKGFFMDHGWDKYEIYWNDWGDPKGFHVFDTETRQLERIVNPLTIYSKIYYDDSAEMNDDMTRYKDKYVKLIVVNKKDLYQFDKFVDKLLQADCHEVKIVEDFSELDANNVSDDIVENTEDTMTLLERYIDELDVTLSKDRLKNTMRTLYTEAQDLEI